MNRISPADTLAAFLLIFLASVQTLQAANGDLDPRFGQDGKVVTESIYDARAVAIQPDGKIIVAGGKVVARYNADGALDPYFGFGGVVTLNLATNLWLNAVALQPDGKILVAGSVAGNREDNDRSDFAVARLNSDGTPDNSFDFDGLAVTDFLPNYYYPVAGHGDRATAIFVQSNGKIIAVGSSDKGGRHSRFALSRFNSDGSLDSGFGIDGYAAESLNGNSVAYAAALQPNGKMVVVGYDGPSAIGAPFAIARFNSSGNLDTGFGNNGKIVDTFNGHGATMYAVAVQPDGKIIAAGASRTEEYGQFGLVRYNSNGTPDTSFGDNGKVETNFVENASGPTHSEAWAMVLQPDGKIVVSGNVSHNDSYFGLARYNSNGTLDTSFNSDGKVTTDLSEGFDGVYDVALQADGRIVAVGTTSNSNFALARYQNTVRPTITGFRLTTKAGQVISVLSNNAVLRASELVFYGELVIEAMTGPAIVGSVHINADFDQHIENSAPYETMPFTIGKGSWQDISLGVHRITATPYSGRDKTGLRGTGRTVSFIVTN